MTKATQRQLIKQGFRKISYRECLMMERWEKVHCPHRASALAGLVKEGVVQAWINTQEQVRYTLTDLGKACLKELTFSKKLNQNGDTRR